MDSTFLLTIFQQVISLMIFIAIGWSLGHFKIVPERSSVILSKLENAVFLPALILGTFVSNFTASTLKGAWKLILESLVLEIIIIPIAYLICKLLSKDDFIKKIYLYGLCFSNFGFMGNAVVSVLFPSIFMEYTIFTLVLWVFINLWGVPVLLMDKGKRELSFGKRMKSFLNPMMIGMLIGAVIGVAGIKLPDFANSVIASAGGCMSPVAMLLTGLTISEIKLGEVLKKVSIYAVSAVRLLIFPLLFIFISAFLPLSEVFVICALCSLAMPLGLNTIVIPNAYGKDPSMGAGMALVSHFLSCVTIPLVFLVYDLIC